MEEHCGQHLVEEGLSSWIWWTRAGIADGMLCFCLPFCFSPVGVQDLWCQTVDQELCPQLHKSLYESKRRQPRALILLSVHTQEWVWCCIQSSAHQINVSCFTRPFAGSQKPKVGVGERAMSTCRAGKAMYCHITVQCIFRKALMFPSGSVLTYALWGITSRARLSSYFCSLKGKKMQQTSAANIWEIVPERSYRTATLVSVVPCTAHHL